ncbi:MAG: hypothetical protein HC846_02620 [Blastocatellia bacterium]|nr:hypothetical protein [Blastocatellia bacterium]
MSQFNLENFSSGFYHYFANQPNITNEKPVDITKLGEILDDNLEAARQEISQSFLNAIENSAKELEKN